MSEWERKAHSLNSHRDDRQNIPRVSNTRRHICPRADRRVPPSRIGSAAVSAAGSDWSRFDPQLILLSSPPCLGYKSAHCGCHSMVMVVVAPPPTGVPIDERTESWQFATLIYAVLEILLNWQRIEKRLTDIELSNDQLKNKQEEKSREEEKQRKNEDSNKARAGQLILQIIIDTSTQRTTWRGISRTQARSISTMPSPTVELFNETGSQLTFHEFDLYTMNDSVDIWAVR